MLKVLMLRFATHVADTVSFKCIDWGMPDYDKMLDLRDHVLSRLLKMVLGCSDLNAAKTTGLDIAVLQSDTVGTAFFFHKSPTTHWLRQFTIHPQFQHMTIGSRFLTYFEALNASATNAHVHARDVALPFYEKHDYGSWYQPLRNEQTDLPGIDGNSRFSWNAPAHPEQQGRPSSSRGCHPKKSEEKSASSQSAHRYRMHVHEVVEDSTKNWRWPLFLTDATWIHGDSADNRVVFAPRVVMQCATSRHRERRQVRAPNALAQQ
jgi:hypothetical protein